MLKKYKDNYFKTDDDIYSFLGRKFKCSYCAKEHYIPTEIVENGKGKINILPSVAEKISRGRKILFLADDITYAVAGQKIQTAFEAKGWHTQKLVLEPKGTQTVHAEEQYFPQIFSALKGVDIILTIGAGSITDMGKYAGHVSGIPLVSFPTAASMNAYTSGIAALIKGGLKITVSVPPPRAVVIDTDIILNSPFSLIQAGFADSLAKSYANADWQLCSILTGEYFCPLPFKIVTVSEKRYITKGRELLTRNEGVVADLMDGLLRGGFSMVIAGTSSPASGGEHLLSHYLDMYAFSKGKEPFAYHGLQVGVGVLISARIYDRLKKLDIKQLKEKIILKTEDDYKKEIKTVFPDSFSVVWAEFKKKLPVLNKLPESLIHNWDRIKEDVLPMVYSEATVRTYLKKAGCPISFSQIGVEKELAYAALTNAFYIRGRITVLDIASCLGILKEVAQEILKEYEK